MSGLHFTLRCSMQGNNSPYCLRLKSHGACGKTSGEAGGALDINHLFRFQLGPQVWLKLEMAIDRYAIEIQGAPAGHELKWLQLSSLSEPTVATRRNAEERSGFLTFKSLQECFISSIF